MLAKNSQAAAMKYLLLCAQQSAFFGVASKLQQQTKLSGRACPNALAATEGGLSTQAAFRAGSVGLIRSFDAVIRGQQPYAACVKRPNSVLYRFCKACVRGASCCVT